MRKIINFFKGIWIIIKSMGNWRGVLSLLITWLIFSGSGLILLGIILKISKLTVIGTSIYAFWLLPLTPLIPFNIAMALLFQRFILMDKSVSIKAIKEKFKNINQKGTDNHDRIREKEIRD